MTDKTKGRLLLIDADLDNKEKLTEYLESNFLDVFSVSTAHEGLGFIDDIDHFDAIVMELVLPDEDGSRLIKDIRKRTYAPIIILSEKKAAIDKIVGLEVGADDYVEKPYNKRELLARIKSHMRRFINYKNQKQKNDSDETKGNGKDSAFYKFAGWVFDPHEYRLSNVDGKQINITKGDYDLLRIFLEKPNKVISRERLFELMHEGDYESYDRAVDTQIARLRKKLKIQDASVKTGDIIKTIRGIGYMLNVDVEVVQKKA